MGKLRIVYRKLVESKNTDDKGEDIMIKCLKCGKESNGKDRCSCGSRNLVYGEGFEFIDGDIICECGKEDYKIVMDVEIGDIWECNYVCGNCGNVVGVERYNK